MFQALARLRFSETVAQSDVDEALRLMQMSKYSLYSDDRQRSGLDAISDIYSILRDEAARTSSMDVKFAHALNLISRKVRSLRTLTGTTQCWPLIANRNSLVCSYWQGYSEAQLKECLEEYASLNVWQIHQTTFDIHFIDAWSGCRHSIINRRWRTLIWTQTFHHNQTMENTVGLMLCGARRLTPLFGTWQDWKSLVITGNVLV